MDAILDFLAMQHTDNYENGFIGSADSKNLSLDTEFIYLWWIEEKLLTFSEMAAILDAILNFSKCSRVTEVHPADSEN